jgi:hypothetical protein
MQSGRILKGKLWLKEGCFASVGGGIDDDDDDDEANESTFRNAVFCS